MANESLRICLISSFRHPVAEPFAGGLEAHTHALAKKLVERGHRVALFAPSNSDPDLDVELLPVRSFSSSELAKQDPNAPEEEWMRAHHAYLGLMKHLVSGGDQFDVIHNNSLNYLPLAMSDMLTTPMLTTLHTPPLPWLESALRYGGEGSEFVAVSAHTSADWDHVVSSDVIRNGVDVDKWHEGPGGRAAFWSGRMVPEKAPHLAIEAAMRAGVPMDLAGPVSDPVYFEGVVKPLLSDSIRYLGHLTHAELVQRVGEARVSVVSPTWDEPFGLVVAESLACGTPVAAFARGGIPEIISADAGRLAPPGDVPALARAIVEASDLDRGRVRRCAERDWTHDRMVDEYEERFLAMAGA